MAETAITKKAVAEADVEQGGELWLWDVVVKGFGLRVRRNSKRLRKDYYFRYGAGKRGRSRKQAIGEHGHAWRPDPDTGLPRVLTTDLARKEAERLRGLVVDRQDPAAVRTASSRIPTLADYDKERYAPFASKKKKASSRGKEIDLMADILPRLGSRRLDRIGPLDIEQLHLAHERTPVKANRMLSLLSHMFTMARTWRVLPADHVNPCRDIQRYPEAPHERLLEEAELARVAEVMAAAETAAREEPKNRLRKLAVSSAAIGALRMIIFTGARPGEIVSLARSEVNEPRRVIMKRDWKTRGKTRVSTVRVIHLSAEAFAVYQEQAAIAGNPYVFPGHIKGTHLTIGGLEGVWQRIRAEAGLDDVRIGDLGRHGYATAGLGLGYSLDTIGRLLGHTQASTTARYAHLAAGPAQDATAAISKKLGGILKGKQDSSETVAPPDEEAPPTR